jgi:ribosomal protein S3
MNNIQSQINLLALAKATKAVRDGAPTGTHEVNGIFRVSGKLTIGDDYIQSFPGALCPWKLARALANKVNYATLEAAIAEASTLEDDSGMKAFVSTRIAGMIARTERLCDGKVTHKCTVEEITKQTTQAKEILSQQAPMGWNEV